MRDFITSWYWRIRIWWEFPPRVERAFKDGYYRGWSEHIHIPDFGCHEDSAWYDYLDKRLRDD